MKSGGGGFLFVFPPYSYCSGSACSKSNSRLLNCHHGSIVMVLYNRGLVNFCAHHVHLIGSRREKEKEWHRRYSHQIGALY